MPKYDIACRTCGGDSEVIVSDITAIVCGCGSIDVEHKWTSPPIVKIMWDANGSTPGVRRKMMDITKKDYEKDRRKAGVSHENTNKYY